MNYVVSCSADAEHDLEAISHFIAEHDSLGRAQYVIDKIIDVISSLTTLADKGNFPRETALGTDPEVTPHLGKRATRKDGLPRKRRYRIPRKQFIDFVGYHIQDSPSKREHRNLFPTLTPRGHELQFQLLLSGTLANKSLHKRGQKRNQQQHLETRPTTRARILQTHTDTRVLCVSKRLFDPHALRVEVGDRVGA